MILPIVTGKNNEILRRKSDPIKKIDAKIKKLSDDMTDTVIKVNGLGIAAPQVGINLRLVIVRMNANTPQQMWVAMINPEITKYSQEEEVKEEGCLSLPGKYDKTMRALRVTAKYTDKKGKEQILHLDGLNAHIMQHEVDHVNGLLYIDRLAPKSE